jgi:hypothetical protein
MNLYFIKKDEENFKFLISDNYTITEKWSNEIQLKGEMSKYYKKIFIISDSNNQKMEFNEKVTYDIQLLKSNLQKAIRKKDTDIAISTCYILIKQDLNELLRRLPIIALEDSYISFQDFNYLIWHMLAVSKGYYINYDIINKILNITEKVTTSNYRDILDSKKISEFNPEQCIKNKNDDFTMFYFGIFIRLEYGTMTGDNIWLKNMANMWLKRITKHNGNISDTIMNKFSNTNNKPEYFDTDSISFNKSHYLPEAVDFHCDKEFFDKVRIKSGVIINNNNEDIKSSVWFLRSSINNREFLKTNKKVQEFIKIYNSQQKKYKKTFAIIETVLPEISMEYWKSSRKANNSLLNYF